MDALRGAAKGTLVQHPYSSGSDDLGCYKGLPRCSYLHYGD